MKNKKIIIAGVVIVVVIFITAGAVVFFVTRSNSQGQTAGASTTGGPQGANFRNFRGVQGSIVSVTGADMILDSGSNGQALVSINDQTSIQKSVVSDQATVLAPGNTVTIRYTNDNGSFKATVISKVDPAQNSEQNFQGNANGGFRNGGPRTFNGQVGGPAGDAQGLQMMFGKVDSVADGKLTLTSQDGNTKTTFAISAATYSVTQKGTTADLVSGAKVQVTGTDSAGKILARTVVVE
jgi:hypothetical protein